MIRRLILLTLLGAQLLGCNVVEDVEPPPPPAGPLTIEVRSGQAVDIRIGTKNVAEIGCGAIVEMTPSLRDKPPLPWDLKVVRGSEVLWTGTVSELPLWMLVTVAGVAVGDAPPIGPDGPPCSL